MGFKMSFFDLRTEKQKRIDLKADQWFKK
jgi:hypothetical protein